MTEIERTLWTIWTSASSEYQNKNKPTQKNRFSSLTPLPTTPSSHCVCYTHINQPNILIRYSILFVCLFDFISTGINRMSMPKNKNIWLLLNCKHCGNWLLVCVIILIKYLCNWMIQFSSFLFCVNSSYFKWDSVRIDAFEKRMICYLLIEEEKITKANKKCPWTEFYCKQTNTNNNNKRKSRLWSYFM